MPKDTKKKPKHFYVKCKGGPADSLRIEGGMEPPAKVPFPRHGYYEYTPQGDTGVYEWVGAP